MYRTEEVDWAGDNYNGWNKSSLGFLPEIKKNTLSCSGNKNSVAFALLAMNFMCLAILFVSCGS